MKELLEGARDRARKLGVQFMDARLVSSESTDIVVQDGKADSVGQGHGTAIGVRVLVDNAWGFASADVLTHEAIGNSLTSAIEMARSSSARVVDPGVVAEVAPVVDTVTMVVERDPRGVPLSEKVTAASRLEESGRIAGGDPVINSVIRYSDLWRREIICNTVGSFVDQEVISTLAAATFTAADGETRQNSFEVVKEQAGFELIERTNPADLSEKAAKKAVELLSANRCPSGKFPVILDPSVAGLFTHEVLGHNAEGDEVFNGMSIISGKIGEQIASELVTIVNDPTIPKLNGTYAYDSEGVPGAPMTIIENGVLKGFMHSLETASRFGAQPTGSGRAESAHKMPIVRMANTYMLPGSNTLDDMISDIDEGMLIQRSNGGYVYPERGQYTCFAKEGRMIRNGRLAEPVREVTFSGMTLDTLRDIDAMSSEIAFDPGTCGKGGQRAPVTDGGPWVRVKEVVVGGQE
jgi:TldD protein